MYKPDDLQFADLLAKKLKDKYGLNYSVVIDTAGKQIHNCMAETASLESALPKKFRIPEKLSSFKLMAYWFALNIILPDYDYLKSKALDEILQIGIQRFDGKNEYKLWDQFIWFFFEEKNLEGMVPKESPFNPAELLDFLLQHFSRDDIFGNFSNLVAFFMSKATELFRLKKPNRSRVRRPQRKRGYNDKGSRRPDWSVPAYRYKTGNSELYLYKQLLRENIRTVECIELNNWYCYPTRLK